MNAESSRSHGHKFQAGLYVMMCLYVLALFVVMIRARINKQKSQKAGAGALSAQYGGSFNVFLLVLTTFASVFSGYTVTGVPAEAAKRGFFSMRWISGLLAIVVGALVLYPRLRRLAVTRNYRGPTDFILDRYRSERLQLLCNACACVPQMFYLAVQLVSFGTLLESITLGSIPKVAGMIIFAILMFAMEILGGMRAVVYSDAVQGILMLVGFFILSFVLAARYGSISENGPPNCSSLEFTNITSFAMLKAQGKELIPPPDCMLPIQQPLGLQLHCKPYGCVGSARPELLNHPTRPEQATYFFFVMNLLAFALNPHMIQRVYVAANDHSLKQVTIALCFAPYLTFLPGVYAGLIKAAYGPSWPLVSQTATAFSSITIELMQKSSFEYFLMSALNCSALAAVMSTADSVILGVTNILTVEVYSRWMAPVASQEQLVRFGGVVCVVMLSVGIAGGSQLEPHQFGALLTLQNGILLQIVPAFVLGLFFDASAMALTAGIVTGCLTVLVSTICGNPLFTYLDVTGAGALVNVLTLVVTQVLLYLTGYCFCTECLADGIAKELFGDPLTKDMIRTIMKDVKEPRPFLLAMSLLLLLASVPIYDSPGKPDVLLLGVPLWAVRSLFAQIAASVTLICAAWTWQAALSPARAVTLDTAELSSVTEKEHENQVQSLPHLLPTGDDVPDTLPDKPQV